MKDLEECRQEIDLIDKQLMELFQQRMQVVKDVVSYKQANGIEILHPEREAEVIEKNQALITDASLKSYAKNFLEDLMAISRSYQASFLPIKQVYQLNPPKLEKLKVGYQGLPGAFSFQAMQEYFGSAEYHSYQFFEEVFKAIQKEEIDYGILPIENSSTGPVSDNYDLVRDYNLYIVGEYSLPVSQNLMAIPGTKLEDIREVISHKQALYQSTRFLDTLKNVIRTEYTNTAASARLVQKKQDHSLAAIASKSAAKIYDLEILVPDINNENNNETRFIIVGKNLEDSNAANCVSIVFTLQHKVGTLYSVLKAIRDQGINMNRIESRPLINQNWQYYFYIDLEGSLHDKNVLLALQHIKSHCLQLRVIGNYKRIE